MSMAIEPGRTVRPLWQKLLIGLVGSLLGLALLITAFLTLTPSGRQVTSLLGGAIEVAQVSKNPELQPTTELGIWQQRWARGLKANFTRLTEAQKAFPNADLAKLETAQDPVKLATVVKAIDSYGTTVRSVRSANAAVLGTAQDDLGAMKIPANVRDGLRRGLDASLVPMIDDWDLALAAEDEHVAALASLYGFLNQLKPGVGYGLVDGHLNFATAADLKEFQARAAHLQEAEQASQTAMAKAQSRVSAMQQDPLGTFIQIMRDQVK